MSRDLRALPKAHLHLHLDGAIRPSTQAELAAAGGIDAAVPTSYASFADFGTAITAAASCLRTPADVERVIAEIVEDAGAAGAVYVQPSLWPGLFGGRLGTSAEALDVVLAAGRAASERLGVGFGVVLAANRDRGAAEAVELARLAADRAGDGVVAFGMDGDETSVPSAEFAEAFAIARAAGLRAIPHAGEGTGPDAVRDALDLLEADQLMHGIAAADDPELLDRLAWTPLHVCPTSNAMLGAVPSLDKHPLPRLLAAGVPCSINADDPTLFGTDLLAEYTVARDVLGLTDEQLAACARTSLLSCDAPTDGVDDWLAG